MHRISIVAEDGISLKSVVLWQKNVSAVVGRYCCHTVSEDRVRVSEFLFGGVNSV